MSTHVRPSTHPAMTLFDYLQSYNPPPIVYISEPRTISGTRSHHSASADCPSPPAVWESFTLAQSSVSPQTHIRVEEQVQRIFYHTLYKHLERALHAMVRSVGSTPVVNTHGQGIRHGSFADQIGVTAQGEIRLVGEIKPSHNFRSGWRYSRERSEREHYRLVVAQVYYYMRCAGCRFGYILTDRELLGVMRKSGHYRDFEVSRPIRWSRNGVNTMRVATALFALYLCAEDDST